MLLRRLESLPGPEGTERRALLLALGEYPAEALEPEERQRLVARLLRDYQDDPDAGIHGARSARKEIEDAAISGLLARDLPGRLERPGWHTHLSITAVLGPEPPRKLHLELGRCADRQHLDRAILERLEGRVLVVDGGFLASGVNQ